jgi:signal transduction histidine kinase
MHGRAIRLKGIVRARPDDTSGERLAQIESDGILISVDANSVPEAQNDLSVGAVLDISGTCFVQTRNWSPNEDLPRAEGFILVVRTPSDITVISRAPWWTPRKILYAAIILLSAIVVTITWNFAVRRLAEKRGQELFKEHIARATAEMRVAERTRLAIELHDSLSQNLSGIALQMESVGRTMDNDPKRARDCLTTAVFLLRSCRDELRNCLYDLRIRALETNDLEDAVRLTVKPHLGESKLDIRFNIARERLSDTTAHAFLRIIRELVVNAVRHGNAGHIWIAGAFEQDGLSFSVRDDGCGFDPKNRPNVSTGHCGLAGIHERVRRLGGNIEIDSTPGRGTKVAVRIKELT